MSSVLGWSPSPEYFASHAYAAAKAAVIGMSKAAASYYAPHNIRVNVIAPALVETPMSQRATGNDEIMRFIRAKQPLDGGRVGMPQDLDGAALFLLSRQSHFITGQVLAVDGGWMREREVTGLGIGMMEVRSWNTAEIHESTNPHSIFLISHVPLHRHRHRRHQHQGRAV